MKCEWCNDYIPARIAVQAAVAGPSGSARPAHACPGCVAEYGILPLDRHPDGSDGAPLFVSPAYVGRPDGPPITPGRQS